MHAVTFVWGEARSSPVVPSKRINMIRPYHQGLSAGLYALWPMMVFSSGMQVAICFEQSRQTIHNERGKIILQVIIVMVKALLAVIVLTITFLPLPQHSAAFTWGYPPDSPIGQCLSSRLTPTKLFPDRALAQAAAQADCKVCRQGGSCDPNVCMCPGPYYPSPYWWEWTCLNNCYSMTGCGIPDCGFSSYSCHSAKERGADFDHASTDFWYPRYPSGCSSYAPPPTQQPDPEITAGVSDKNLGRPAGVCNSVGNPINVSTGLKFEEVLDLSVSAPGIPLEFRRFYNSVLASDGPLGFGWTHSFCMKLDVVQPEPLLRVKIRDTDGRFLYFSKVFQAYPDGTHFYGESGVKDRLVKLSSGQYMLRRKKDNLTYLFSADGKVAQISDPNGNTLTLTYDSGLLTQVTNNFGQSITIRYNGSRISSIIDPKNQPVSYGYDGSSNLTHVAYPDGQSTSYVYDAGHRLTDKKDTTNNVIGHWHYNGEGRVDTWYRFLRDGIPQERIDLSYMTASEPRTITLTRSTGTTTYTSVVKDGIRVITGIEGCGATCGGDTHKAFTYDRWLNLTDAISISEGRSYSTHYTYDEPANFWDRVGEIVQTSEAVGFPEERATRYTSTHRTDDPFLLIQKTETKPSVLASGQDKVITTNYDAYGKITSRAVMGYVLVNGVPIQKVYVTGFQYNSLGQLIRIDGPRTDVADITVVAYHPNDASQGSNRGRLMTITDAAGHITQYSNYDANGNVGTITDRNGVITDLSYDQRNRIRSITNRSMNAVTQYLYDSRGNISSIIPPEGDRLGFTYNPADRVTEITDNLGNMIKHDYDVEGNRISESTYDPQQHLKKSLTFAFDAYNRLKTVINADATYSEYTYDGKGNRTGARDARGNATSYTYDSLDRLIQTTGPLTTITDQAYDTQDNLMSVTDPNEDTTQYWFDDFGRKNHSISPDTGTTQYHYDEAGNLTQQVDAKGTAINYTYDALNRVTSVRFPSDPGQNITYAYDSPSVSYGIGRLTGRIDPSGTYVFHYDAQGNMTKEEKILEGILYTTRYRYNKNNALTSITYPSGRTVAYFFDGAGRINQVSATMNGAPTTLASSITYLPFGGITELIYGNRLSLIRGYDNQYRVTSIAAGYVLDLSYSYDGNGNIISAADPVNPAAGVPHDPTGVYSYEQGSNVLLAISGPSPRTFISDLNGNIIADNNRAYEYDDLNRLITVTENTTQIAAYTYNALNQRIKKATSAGTTIYHYDPQGRLIGEANSSGQTLVEYVYVGDELLAMIRSGENIYYYHNDHLGAPRALTNGSGDLVWKGFYAPFGAVNINSASIENNLRFPGQYYDTETGLHYNWNRYYDPKTGRYITPDPIGLEGGINPFVYVAGNPVNFADVWGLWGEDVHSGIGNSDYGTYLWATQSGFSPTEAQAIAKANVGTDGGFGSFMPVIGLQSRHFNESECGKDSRDIWASIELDRAVDYYKHGNNNAAIGHLGKGLHSVQDKWSHRDWYTGWHGWNPHPSWYDSWTDPRNGVAREQTEVSTKQYLQLFLIRTGQR